MATVPETPGCLGWLAAKSRTNCLGHDLGGRMQIESERIDQEGRIGLSANVEVNDQVKKIRGCITSP